MSSRFLSLHERIRIADRAREPGISLRMIAAEPGRPVSTVSRELHRNQQPDGTCPRATPRPRSATPRSPRSRRCPSSRAGR
ncbi:helix-turn-helix domain-containing protein [Amycolatopsis sp. NPDC049691]|uniref:helix-turn-helix domain-containing protein n=1 Tax=Amycolatopsis sp. NPDC049691 TaxID=3155155 RepID=UPI00342BC940